MSDKEQNFLSDKKIVLKISLDKYISCTYHTSDTVQGSEETTVNKMVGDAILTKSMT